MPEGNWTPAIRDVLVRMARSERYEVANESRVVCGHRADQRWLEGKVSPVIIEHENRSDNNLDGEIDKLCNDVSKLKVLITYVQDQKFDECAQIIADRVRSAIDVQAGSFTGEFLLVVAGYVKNDWIGFRSALRPQMKSIK